MTILLKKHSLPFVLLCSFLSCLLGSGLSKSTTQFSQSLQNDKSPTRFGNLQNPDGCTATPYPITDIPEYVPTPYVATNKIIRQIQHDPHAFTQGLLYKDGFLYESTGLYGESSIRKIDSENGEIIESVTLPAEVFGEGLAFAQDKLYLLTWTSGVGFVYDINNLSLIETFSYPNEGWGLTFDGSFLIMSDGTQLLYFIDPISHKINHYIPVIDGQTDICFINELEYIHGEIYANIWQTSRIARIDPKTGRIIAWIDLGPLVQQLRAEYGVDVLNGIAYDAERDRIFITGKLWPFIYEVKFSPLKGNYQLIY